MTPSLGTSICCRCSLRKEEKEGGRERKRNKERKKEGRKEGKRKKERKKEEELKKERKREKKESRGKDVRRVELRYPGGNRLCRHTSETPGRGKKKKKKESPKLGGVLNAHQNGVHILL